MRDARKRIGWLLWALAAWNLAQPGVATATTPAAPSASASLRAAEAHHGRGVELYGQRRFEAALAEFERAYALYPEPRLLFTLGQLEFELGRHARALSALRAYLEQVGSAVPAERRVQVERQIEALRSLTGYIHVSVSAPGARILIDGENAGVSPLLRPLLVGVGRRRVTATRAEQAPTSVEVLVRAGEMSEATLSFPEMPASSGSTLAQVSWLTTGGLAALALGAAVMTVVSHRRYDDARRKPSDADPAEVQRALEGRARQVRTWAVLADVLTGAAVLSGGVALYVSATDGSASTAAPGAHAGLPMDAQINVAFEF